MKWTAKETRETFLRFFEEKGHRRVPSSPLLPKGDPTLLFTNAGMNQFKPYFLGELDPPFRRATSVQKCMRAGGKHNDLDNVGYTRRHHTFFEMLGNFSFGDYFKREAILWAWELLVDVYGLDPNRMWASVYKDDDEAYEIWLKDIGLPEERILRLGEKDNFWEMGDVGPCGPSSEIHYDLGEELDPNQPSPREEGERFLELWNLVFMQYNREVDGNLVPLPKKNIDTGLGLERLLAVLQGVDSNYHTDLFMPIIEEVERITDSPYEPGPKGAPHRVIADHIRALVFAITDGIYPSNYGRGYVLRRILRRAHGFLQRLGKDRPILYRLVPTVVEIMRDAYPEIEKKQEEVSLIIKSEEDRFLDTLSSNLPRLFEAVERAKERGILPGDVAFKLYDTYGLPLDLMEDYAREAGIRIDYEGFNVEMEKQRSKGRKREKVEVREWQVYNDVPHSKFVGYESLESESLIVKSRKVKDNLYEVVLDTTPFYAEAGGQVGDKGTIEGENFFMEVVDTQRIENDIIHIGRLKKGKIGPWKVIARVDKNHRFGCQRSHTATHLLHASLKNILGDHVRQEGSLVEPDRLRFDFTHFRPLTKEEWRRIEEMVNEKIMENIELTFRWMEYKRALEEGVTALFTEKYGEKVRVVSINEFSKELCGGTHCQRTGDIGFFKIVKEEAVAAGIRRIDALTGRRAHKLVLDWEEILGHLSEELASEIKILPQKVRSLIEEKNELDKERAEILQKLLKSIANKLMEKVDNVNGVSLYIDSIEGVPPEGLRKLHDFLRDRERNPWVIALGGSFKGRAFLFIRVHRELVQHVSAVDLIRSVSEYIGGGGGGDREKAEGGGKRPEGLKDAIKTLRDKVHSLIREMAEAQ